MTTHTPPSGNVDQAELDKFSALASRWWDPHSEFKPLHAINPLRLNWIKELVGGLQGKKILDVGCGGGILAESMAAAGADVTGIDLADKSLKVAQLHGLESGVPVTYRSISAEDLAAEQPAQFDIVTANAYAIHRGDEQQLKFQNALKKIGFTVKLKPYIQRRDGSAKGDWDVGITIDILEAARELETIILLSGDGDFDMLLEKVKRTYGATTEVYGVAELTSRSLIESASFFHPITDDLLI